MLNVLALIESKGHVCYRYRIEAYESALREAGARLTALPLARDVSGFWRQLKTVARADVVILQRKLLPWWNLLMLRRAAKRLMYDLDDAVFYRDSNSERAPHSLTRWRRFRSTVRCADVVIAGNEFLCQQAARCALSANVELFPTCIDTRRYPITLRRERRSGLRLVWIGSRSTMPVLLELRAHLEQAARHVAGLTLHVICDAFPDLGQVSVRRSVWTEANEVAMLAEADVGISWLPDHPWSLGKCGLKVLQYMAAGLPVVANPVGVHLAQIRPGATGYLATSPAEWSEALAELASADWERKRMGVAARQLVNQRYNAEAWGHRFARLVTNLGDASGLRKVA